MSRLMNSDDRIIVKRRYLEPIPEDKEFGKVRVGTSKYNTMMRSRKCITCPNIATQLLCCDVDGATFTERYCDNCIKENKHTKENEVMTNFDNLFIRKEPER